MTPEFVEYSHQVVKNCKALGEALTKSGHKLVTGGTDNHLLLVDLRPHGVTGSKVEAMCDCVSITLNKNAVPGDYVGFACFSLHMLLFKCCVVLMC
jgi:glycine hydroxymethyltransferase